MQRIAIVFDGFDSALFSIGEVALLSAESVVTDDQRKQYPSTPLVAAPQEIDELWLASGDGVLAAMRDAKIMTCVVNLVERATQVMAVGQGVILLGAAGFTQGRDVTLPEPFHQRMRVVSPACRIGIVAVIRDGKFLTAKQYDAAVAV